MYTFEEHDVACSDFVEWRHANSTKPGFDRFLARENFFQVGFCKYRWVTADVVPGAGTCQSAEIYWLFMLFQFLLQSYMERGDIFQHIHLAGLPLPNYKPTFAAMEHFRATRPGPYECEGVPIEALSLSFVRTVATIAVTRTRGLLWGNDIASLQ